MPNDKLTEEEVKHRYITPAIEKSSWTKNQIRMEYFFTDGRIITVGDHTTRGKKKKADYLLRYDSAVNLAVVEAKDMEHSVGAGLLQALEYALALGIPFAYSSNGTGFIERDLITGMERSIGINDFPSPQALWERYIAEKQFTSEQLKIVQSPYHVSQNFIPRYYQRTSVNSAVEAVAKGQDRILLVMATGTGKTYTAFQIVWRLKQANKIKKVLYLADRNILIRKPFNEEFAPFGSKKHIVKNSNLDSSYEVYFALYQQLDGEDNKQAYRQVKPEFFDLIIVDECHRGSAKDDSRWREILEYFSGAIQIGMTATPKAYYEGEEENIEDIAKAYFGKPVYTYSLKNGIDDGFLAPYKVYQPFLDIDVTGYRPHEGDLDINGLPVEDRVYTITDFDRNIVVNSRTEAVAKRITQFLKVNDRYAKTIVFCCNVPHAERLRSALTNCNSDLCSENPKYVTQITGYHQDDLDDFVKVEFNAKTDPVIVTTSELMTTGVDCKTTKLIVLDTIINSMTKFKQIVGRGTRLRPDCGKEYFTIMDFRNVTRLFADPRWDGDVEYVKTLTPTGEGGTPPPPPGPTYHIDGSEITLIAEKVQILTPDGKLTTESLINYTRRNILNEYATLNEFINKWNSEKKRKAIIEELREHGVLLDALKEEIGIDNIDDFDLICHIAFDQKPLTKSERAKNVKKKGYLYKYSGMARQVLERLLEKYCDDGIEDIDDIGILKLQDFIAFGTPKQILTNIFGGREKYISAVTELKQILYSTAA